ncbi:MAG TPA: Rho termination factor N-terminal domain-containing protein, partial [Tepidisphaeraceae bacterium]|nr:Rho termination factor N-terminal domain-containing protein [Tepidisphaeraceae bacterium]
MAKTQSRTRRSPSQSTEPQEESQPSASTAIEAPEEPKAPPARAEKTEDVGSFDAETNAKYEQVKGGKLFIKDLQQMDTHQLHEIAKQENISDYVGLKKQDLIFQILRSRIRQNGLMYGEGV